MWFNESFATYGEWLWLDHVGVDEPRRGGASGTSAVRQHRREPTRRPTVGDLFGFERYDGGAVVLHALRRRSATTRSSRCSSGGWPTTTARRAPRDDFIALAEEVSGRALAAFFDDWLYAPALPDVPRLSRTCPAEPAGPAHGRLEWIGRSVAGERPRSHDQPRRASGRGDPSPASAASAAAAAMRPRLTPIQRSGSGSHRRDGGRPTAGGEVGVAARDQVGQRAAGQVRRRDAVADVATGHGDARRPVEPHAAVPVPGDAERTTPVVREVDVGEHGEQVADRVDEHGPHPLVGVEAGVDARPEVVRGAAAAEGQPAVGGALPVDDRVAGVVERRSVGQPDRRPTAPRSAASVPTIRE